MTDTTKYTVRIEVAEAGDAGAIEVQALLNRALAQQATLQGPTGQEVPIPDGSIAQHLHKRASEFSDLTGYVKIVLEPETPQASVTPIEVPIPARQGAPYSQTEIMIIAQQELIRKGIPLTVTVPSTNTEIPNQSSESGTNSC